MLLGILSLSRYPESTSITRPGSSPRKSVLEKPAACVMSRGTHTCRARIAPEIRVEAPLEHDPAVDALRLIGVARHDAHAQRRVGRVAEEMRGVARLVLGPRAPHVRGERRAYVTIAKQHQRAEGDRMD